MVTPELLCKKSTKTEKICTTEEKIAIYTRMDGEILLLDTWGVKILPDENQNDNNKDVHHEMYHQSYFVR